MQWVNEYSQSVLKEHSYFFMKYFFNIRTIFVRNGKKSKYIHRYMK